ncbi:hypothetical protein [Pseudomonas sp. HLT2-19-2]
MSVRSLSALADVGTLLLCVKLMSLVATRRATWIAALLLALLPILMVFLLSLIVPLFVPRYLMFAAVGLPMICAVALDSWGPRRTLFVAVAVALLVVVEVQGLFAVYRQTDGLDGTSLRKDFRLDAMAVEITRQAHPGDKIVFDSLIYYLPFTYYNTSGIQPRFHIKSSLSGLRDDLDRGGYALIPQHQKWVFFNDVRELKLSAGRVWWITDLPASENEVLFANDWKQTLTIKGAGIEARLFTFDAAPTSPEADAQSMLTQQPPH